jgi:hypothetical protein
MNFENCPIHFLGEARLYKVGNFVRFVASDYDKSPLKMKGRPQGRATRFENRV